MMQCYHCIAIQTWLKRCRGVTKQGKSYSINASCYQSYKYCYLHTPDEIRHLIFLCVEWVYKSAATVQSNFFEIEMNFSNGSIEFSVNGKLHRGTYLTVTQIVPYLKRIKSL